MKRSFSESDSDEGDLYERNDKEWVLLKTLCDLLMPLKSLLTISFTHLSSDGVDGENTEACARKRRRGVREIVKIYFRQKKPYNFMRAKEAEILVFSTANWKEEARSN